MKSPFQSLVRYEPVDLDTFLRQPGAGVLRINLAANGKFFATLHRADEAMFAQAWGDTAAETLAKLDVPVPDEDQGELLV